MLVWPLWLQRIISRSFVIADRGTVHAAVMRVAQGKLKLRRSFKRITFPLTFRRIQGSIKDEKKKKFVTGEWFSEVKAKRFQEDLEGSDLLRASIRRKKGKLESKYVNVCFKPNWWTRKRWSVCGSPCTGAFWEPNFSLKNRFCAKLSVLEKISVYENQGPREKIQHGKRPRSKLFTSYMQKMLSPHFCLFIPKCLICQKSLVSFLVTEARRKGDNVRQFLASDWYVWVRDPSISQTDLVATTRQLLWQASRMVRSVTSLQRQRVPLIFWQKFAPSQREVKA